MNSGSVPPPCGIDRSLRQMSAFRIGWVEGMNSGSVPPPGYHRSVKSAFVWKVDMNCCEIKASNWPRANYPGFWLVEIISET